MNQRRRNILIACAALVVGVGLAAWFGSRGGRAEVKIVLVGFTNDPLGLWPPFALAGQTSAPVVVCALLLSNAGSASLKFYDYDLDDGINLLPKTRSSLEYPTQISRLMILPQMKPGECASFLFVPPDRTNIFRCRFGFRRIGLRDRMSGVFKGSGWGLLAEKIEPDSTSKGVRWSSTDWITNPPALR